MFLAPTSFSARRAPVKGGGDMINIDMRFDNGLNRVFANQ